MRKFILGTIWSAALCNLWWCYYIFGSRVEPRNLFSAALTYSILSLIGIIIYLITSKDK